MLIKKYGITIGDKLAEGIIEIGMTKDMVVDLDMMTLYYTLIVFQIQWIGMTML